MLGVTLTLQAAKSDLFKSLSWIRPLNGRQLNRPKTRDWNKILHFPPLALMLRQTTEYRFSISGAEPDTTRSHRYVDR